MIGLCVRAWGLLTHTAKPHNGQNAPKRKFEEVKLSFPIWLVQGVLRDRAREREREREKERERERGALGENNI